jgi:hypothetical protein
MSLYSVRRFHAAFGGKTRIELAVAHLQRQLILGHSLVALALEIEHAAQINVRPRE